MLFKEFLIECGWVLSMTTMGTIVENDTPI